MHSYTDKHLTTEEKIKEMKRARTINAGAMMVVLTREAPNSDFIVENIKYMLEYISEEEKANIIKHIMETTKNTL